LKLEDFMTEKTAKKLKTFLASPGVNKNYIAQYSNDRKRYDKFIISAFKNDKGYDIIEKLKKYLKKEGFSDRIISTLTNRYLYGISLLETYTDKS